MVSVRNHHWPPAQIHVKNLLANIGRQTAFVCSGSNLNNVNGKCTRTRSGKVLRMTVSHILRLPAARVILLGLTPNVVHRGWSYRDLSSAFTRVLGAATVDGDLVCSRPASRPNTPSWPRPSVRPCKSRLVTPFYHYNVPPDGMVCLDLLQSSWSPGVTARRVLEAATQDLALSPDALNTLDAFKGALYRDGLPLPTPWAMQPSLSRRWQLGTTCLSTRRTRP